MEPSPPRTAPTGSMCILDGIAYYVACYNGEQRIVKFDLKSCLVLGIGNFKGKYGLNSVSRVINFDTNTLMIVDFYNGNWIIFDQNLEICDHGTKLFFGEESNCSLYFLEGPIANKDDEEWFLMGTHFAKVQRCSMGIELKKHDIQSLLAAYYGLILKLDNFSEEPIVESEYYSIKEFLCS